MSTPDEWSAIFLRREKIVDKIRSLAPMADPTLDFELLLKNIPSCDFNKIFELFLVEDGIPTESHSDSAGKMIKEENESKKIYWDTFVKMICNYRVNPSMYMSFLSFIFNKNKVLAKKTLQTADFNFTDCIYHDVITQDDFETVLSYDVALGSDIFRNKENTVLYDICSSPIISIAQINKIKKLVSVYGPDIMLWTCNNSKGTLYTNVNIFLRFGHIMNNDPCFKADETLDFLINVCPLALKQSVDIGSEKENAYTIVMERCDSETNPRHQMIVHNVFKYFYLGDLHTIYNAKGQTFQDLVGESGNSLVLGYLEKKFDIRIPNTSA